MTVLPELERQLRVAHKRRFGRRFRVRSVARTIAPTAACAIVVAAVVVVVVPHRVSEREITPRTTADSRPAAIAAAVGGRLAPIPGRLKDLLPPSAGTLGLDLDRGVRIKPPARAKGPWFVIGGTDGVCVILGVGAKCASTKTFYAGRLVQVIDDGSGPIELASVLPGDFERAVATLSSGTQLVSSPIRDHAYRLLADGPQAGSANVLLVRPDGHKEVAYRAFRPSDIDRLFPGADASVSKAELDYRLRRNPSLIPESLRRLPAPPIPKGATFGGHDRQWYVGATPREIYLWAGNGGAGAPSDYARHEGLATASIPGDRPNGALPERIQGARPEPITAVRAISRNGDPIPATTGVRGQAYDLYMRDSTDLAYLEFVDANGEVTRGLP